MQVRLRAVALDLHAASLLSLQEALSEWQIEMVYGATTASLHHERNPTAAELLVVKAGEEVAETLGLCRFLVLCGIFATDCRDEVVQTWGLRKHRQDQARRVDAPLLVLTAGPCQGSSRNVGPRAAG